MSHRARSVWVGAAALCVLVGTCATAMGASITIERIIARINNDIITLSEIQEAVKPEVDKLRKTYRGEELERRMREVELRSLGTMIESKLALQRAAAIEVGVSEKEVEEAVAGVLRRNKTTTAGLRTFLARQGISFEEYRKRLREGLLSRKVERMEVGVHVTVGEQEIADHYDAHQDEYREGESRVVRQIFFASSGRSPRAQAQAQRKKADRLYARATKPGADFAQLARNHSEGPARTRGGYLGEVKRGEVFPELEQIIFSTKAGAISKPTKTRVGYHIVHVEEVKPGKAIPLDRVAGRIRQKIYAEKFSQKRREWMEGLRSSAFVEVRYDSAPSAEGLSSLFKSDEVREQVSFHLVGIRLDKGGNLFGRAKILWAYGSKRAKPRWKSAELRVDANFALEKTDISTLASGQRTFVNPDPSANLYLFSHRYLLPDSYIGQVSFADAIRAFSLDGKKGGGKLTLQTDTGAAWVDFEVEVSQTRSIVADSKVISR